VGRQVIEIPAGLIGDSGQESWETAALRELEEETGWTAEGMEKLTEGPTSAGLTSECVIFARARGVKRGGGQKLDSDEKITVHEVKMGEVAAWLREQEAAGMMVDPKVWAALYFVKCGG